MYDVVMRCYMARCGAAIIQADIKMRGYKLPQYYTTRTPHPHQNFFKANQQPININHVKISCVKITV